MLVAKTACTAAMAPGSSVAKAWSVYFARRKSAIFCAASAFVVMASCVMACTATRLMFGRLRERVPLAMAFSVASLAVGKMWAGRLWQSMQSITRIRSAGGSPLKAGVRNTREVPSFRLVTRVQGMSCRLSSVA